VNDVRQTALMLSSGHVVLPAVFSSLSNRLFTLTIRDTKAVDTVHQCQRLVAEARNASLGCPCDSCVGWHAAGVQFSSTLPALPYSSGPTCCSPKGPASPHF